MSGETRYILTVGGLNVVDLKNNVEVYLTDGTNNSQTVTYGAESFAAQTRDDESLCGLVIAMMKYIGSASEYFDPKGYLRDGDYIYFGEYAQTRVTDEALTEILDEQASEWKSYGYYAAVLFPIICNNTDVEYDGKKYRGVKSRSTEWIPRRFPIPLGRTTTVTKRIRRTGSNTRPLSGV